MTTVIDIQQIVKGRALNQGQAFISALGVDPVTSTQLAIFSDIGLTVPIVAPFILNQDGWITDSATGLSYVTVYVAEASYSIQLRDSFNVSVLVPYRQFDNTVEEFAYKLRTFAINDTPTIADVNGYLIANVAIATNVTIVNEATQAWEAGQYFLIRQSGAGLLTMVAGAGVTLLGNLSTVAQFDVIGCIYRGSDVWDIINAN